MQTIELSTLRWSLERAEGWYWEHLGSILTADIEGTEVELTPDCFESEALDLLQSLRETLEYRLETLKVEYPRTAVTAALAGAQVYNTYWGPKIILPNLKIGGWYEDPE